jgi:recombination endonuclease VII
MPALSKIFTRGQIDAMRRDLIEKHGNQCAVCGKPREAFKKSLAVDHDHRSGKIRGLLDFRCNKFLVGRFTTKTILPVMMYLLKYEYEGDIWQKYGKILSDLKDDIK